MGRVNYARWIQQLGLKRDDEPGLVHAVQPVSIVGDQRGLVSPALGIVGQFGGSVHSNVANVGYIVRSPAPVRLLMTITSQTGHNLQYGGLAVDPNPSQADETPISAQMISGVTSARFSKFSPLIGVTSFGTGVLNDETSATVRVVTTDHLQIKSWCPAGGVFYVVTNQVNVRLSLGCHFIEYPTDKAQ